LFSLANAFWILQFGFWDYTAACEQPNGNENHACCLRRFCDGRGKKKSSGIPEDFFGVVIMVA